MTKNQALMALKKVKRNLKQAAALEELLYAAGDAIDKEDSEFLFMQDSVKDCLAKLGKAKEMLEAYSRAKVMG